MPSSSPELSAPGPALSISFPALSASGNALYLILALHFLLLALQCLLLVLYCLVYPALHMILIMYYFAPDLALYASSPALSTLSPGHALHACFWSTTAVSSHGFFTVYSLFCVVCSWFWNVLALSAPG